MYKEIDKYLSRTIELSNDELDLFHSYLEYKKFGKKTFLLRAGDVCNYEAFVIKGCLRMYFVDEKGFEVNMMFPVEDWWFGDLASSINNTPSSLNIEAMEDCELFFIDINKKEKLLAQIPKLERMFRIMLTRSIVALQNRIYKTIAKSAEERYLEFIETYPSIPQRIPQHHIASFLGISPEFLSKIRKKLSGKK